MILGGVFDQYPKLQIVIGHLGEALPVYDPAGGQHAARDDKTQTSDQLLPLRENVHYTFSGFNFTPTFIDLLLQVGVDRIMFSADYPYASMVEGTSVPRQAAGESG